MKILITGGLGFIGSHLAKKYLEKGNKVYLIDNLSTGSRKNIEELETNDNFKRNLVVYEDTIFNEDLILMLVGISDMVIHLAAAVGVKYILDNPLDSITTNIRGTEILLKYCEKFKKKIFIASTSECYGKHQHAPLLETDDSVFGPSNKSRWSYAASKLIDEFTAIAYHKTKNLDVVIGRLFNTVGPKQRGRYGMVIPRFFKQAISHQPITVYGDGNQTRTFTHVDDTTNAIMGLMENDKCFGQVYNIGGSQEVSIMELAKEIIAFVKSDSEIQIIPYSDVYKSEDFEDMQRRVPSIEKIQNQTGWKSTKKRSEILQSIYDSIKS